MPILAYSCCTVLTFFAVDPALFVCYCVHTLYGTQHLSTSITTCVQVIHVHMSLHTTHCSVKAHKVNIHSVYNVRTCMYVFCSHFPTMDFSIAQDNTMSYYTLANIRTHTQHVHVHVHAFCQVATLLKQVSCVHHACTFWQVTPSHNTLPCTCSHLMCQSTQSHLLEIILITQALVVTIHSTQWSRHSALV